MFELKKTIFQRLAITIILCSLTILGVNYLLQMELARNYMERKAQIKLNQIEEVLRDNEAEVNLIKEELAEDYIIRAKAAAYMIEKQPDSEHDAEELCKIAELLQVDELHLFNKEGILFSGTKPIYYGMSMNDGEQIGYFRQMLQDTSMELVQEMVPNTAEGALMQYVAVWREDGAGIVQVGMQPKRLMEAMKKNEISYIFSKVLLESDTILYAIDIESSEIVGCSEEQRIGENAEAIGLAMPDDVTKDYGFFVTLDKKDYYCIFEKVGDQYIGIAQEESQMYRDVYGNARRLAIYLAVIVVIMIVAILVQLDRQIIQGINRINRTLAEIARGNLDRKVTENSTPEFEVLSTNINLMVNSILDSTGTLSKLFEQADVEIGVYEYYRDMKRVLMTKKTADLLGLSGEEKKHALSNKEAFEAYVEKVKQSVVEGAKDIYVIPGEETRYVRITSFHKGEATYGVVVDETADILEKQRIEHERDSDMLTGLYSRRAFFQKARRLFEKPEEMKNAVILMADVDYLKIANDTYGHGFGDCLIKSAAELFQNSRMPHTLAVRLSGDEFALLIYGADSKAELKEEVLRIYQEMMKKTIQTPDGIEYPVRLSAGYVFYPQQVQNFDELMHYADNAMYRVKRKSKANFMEYDDNNM